MLSILITTNNIKYINECLYSIKEQTWMPEYEVLILTDGCESCYQYLNSIHEHFDNVKIYAAPVNMGLSVGKNTLLSIAEGDEYLIFDSDDLMCPDMVKTIYQYDGDIRRFRFNMINTGKPVNTNSVHYAGGCFWMNKKAYQTLGGFLDWRNSADTEFHARAASSDLEITFMEDRLFYYRQHEDSMTSVVPIAERIRRNAMIKPYYNSHELKITPVTNKYF